MRVVYGKAMVAQSKSFSPSPGKPQLLVEHLQSLGYPMDLHEPLALSRDALCLAHDSAYVDGVLNCTLANGFGNREAAVAASLPYTSGSLYRAACLALEHGLAASFSSGFHHAGYRYGGGFCTFNGLAITARRLYTEGRIRRLLILDADYHYGDGTDDIIQKLSLDYVRHETLGRTFRCIHRGEDYLGALQEIMDSLAQAPVDLILYQAGADVHEDDPLGGILSTEQMAERDRMVFAGARALQRPLAWNLAGGYQRDANNSILPVLKLHEQTYRIAMEAYGELPAIAPQTRDSRGGEHPAAP